MENRRCQHPQQPNAQAQEASSGPQSSMPQSPLLSGASSLISLTQTEEFFDLIASSQSRRLDDQRASIGDRLGIRIQLKFDIRCEIINDQRCSLPPAPDPDEDFFSLIQRVQSKRMDEQRVSFPSDENDETDLNYKSKTSEGSS
uniref:G protein signaling modulator 1a n=1 Tax=Sinocyclocheilus grahami TaxID=75366 RepID=A0A672L228_SINGR